MAKDIKALLRDAKLPERSVVLCLNQDLNSLLQAKERQLAEAERGPDMSSLDGSGNLPLRMEIAEIQSRMGEHNVEFKFRALNRNAYTALIKANPPKEGDTLDEDNGFDWDKVTDLLLHQCLFDPEMDEEDWNILLGDGTDEFPGVLSSVQYDTLAATVWRVNRRDVDVPFSPNSSLSSLISDAP